MRAGKSMRFTKVQAMLFRCEMSFAHIASTRERAQKAKSDFLKELDNMGTYYTPGMNGHIYRGQASGSAFAYFGYDTPTPASIVDHPPVIFMDGKRSEFKTPRFYEDCKFIPAEVKGAGPMVIR